MTLLMFENDYVNYLIEKVIKNQLKYNLLNYFIMSYNILFSCVIILLVVI